MNKFRVIIFIEKYSDILRDKILHLLSNKNPEDVEFWSSRTPLDIELSKRGYNYVFKMQNEDLTHMIVEESVLKPNSTWHWNYLQRKHLKTRIIKK